MPGPLIDIPYARANSPFMVSGSDVLSAGFFIAAEAFCPDPLCCPEQSKVGSKVKRTRAKRRLTRHMWRSFQSGFNVGLGLMLRLFPWEHSLSSQNSPSAGVTDR